MNKSCHVLQAVKNKFCHIWNDDFRWHGSLHCEFAYVYKSCHVLHTRSCTHESRKCIRMSICSIWMRHVSMHLQFYCTIYMYWFIYIHGSNQGVNESCHIYRQNIIEFHSLTSTECVFKCILYTCSIWMRLVVYQRNMLLFFFWSLSLSHLFSLSFALSLYVYVHKYIYIHMSTYIYVYIYIYIVAVREQMRHVT